MKILTPSLLSLSLSLFVPLLLPEQEEESKGRSFHSALTVVIRNETGREKYRVGERWELLASVCESVHVCMNICAKWGETVRGRKITHRAPFLKDPRGWNKTRQQLKKIVCLAMRQNSMCQITIILYYIILLWDTCSSCSVWAHQNQIPINYVQVAIILYYNT